MTYHVVPVADVRTHQECVADCWCEPRVEDYGRDASGAPARVYVHHAADGREHAEPDHARATCATCRIGLAATGRA